MVVKLKEAFFYEQVRASLVDKLLAGFCVCKNLKLSHVSMNGMRVWTYYVYSAAAEKGSEGGTTWFVGEAQCDLNVLVERSMFL